jgi:hypothetical protein
MKVTLWWFCVNQESNEIRLQWARRSDQFAENHMCITFSGYCTTFRKKLIKAFSMFDSVGDALDKLQALRMKKNNSINEHIAKFKRLMAKSKIDTMNPLTIKLFEETLPWDLTLQLMKLKTPLKTMNDWYTWAVTLDHRHHKLTRATKWTRGNITKDKTLNRRYYFPWRERDQNAMDIDRLSINEWTRLMKEGRCFKCKNTRHQANKCPDNKKEEYKEEPKKEDERKRTPCPHTSFIQGHDWGRQGRVYERWWRTGFLKRRATLTLVSPCLDVYSVTIANISCNSISVPINICLSKQTVKTLINSGADGMFIDQNFTRDFKINYLDEPVKAYNVDRMENKWGTISSYINLEFKLRDRTFNKWFYVTRLGKQKIILGFPWLHKHNPIINWEKSLGNLIELTGDALLKKRNQKGMTT